MTTMNATETKPADAATQFKAITETDDERRARLKKDVGILDYAIVKSNLPEIPDEFLMRLMYGGR